MDQLDETLVRSIIGYLGELQSWEQGNVHVESALASLRQVAVGDAHDVIPLRTVAQTYLSVRTANRAPTPSTVTPAPAPSPPPGAVTSAPTPSAAAPSAAGIAMTSIIESVPTSLRKRFMGYLKKLKNNSDYFKEVPEESAGYMARVIKARDKYMGKHPEQQLLPLDPDALKNKGNELLGAEDTEGAIAYYSAAVLLAGPGDDRCAVYYSNRAAVYQRLERYGEAEQDALMATQARPAWAKAWVRLATAQESAGRIQEALASFSAALDLEADNQLASEGVSRCGAAADAPPAAGGIPNISAMLNNPDVMRQAQAAMAANPQMMQDAMRHVNPEMLMGMFAGLGGGAAPPAATATGPAVVEEEAGEEASAEQE